MGCFHRQIIWERQWKTCLFWKTGTALVQIMIRLLWPGIENFNNNWDKISNKYSERFYRMWKYFLLSSAGSFRSRKTKPALADGSFKRRCARRLSVSQMISMRPESYPRRKLTTLVLSFEYGGYLSQISKRFDLTSTDLRFEKVSNDFFP